MPDNLYSSRYLKESYRRLHEDFRCPAIGRLRTACECRLISGPLDRPGGGFLALYRRDQGVRRGRGAELVLTGNRGPHFTLLVEMYKEDHQVQHPLCLLSWDKVIGKDVKYDRGNTGFV